MWSRKSKTIHYVPTMLSISKLYNLIFFLRSSYQCFISSSSCRDCLIMSIKTIASNPIDTFETDLTFEMNITNKVVLDVASSHAQLRRYGFFCFKLGPMIVRHRGVSNAVQWVTDRRYWELEERESSDYGAVNRVGCSVGWESHNYLL